MQFMLESVILVGSGINKGIFELIPLSEFLCMEKDFKKIYNTFFGISFLVKTKTKNYSFVLH